MIDYTGTDLATTPGSIRVQKTKACVQVRFAREDGSADTLEGPVAYRRGAALITGTGGETWPVEEPHFQAAYTPVHPTVYGEDGIYYRIPIQAWALQADQACTVTIASGEVLCGKAGDWLLQYESGDYGIVERVIFTTLYEPV